MPKRKKKQPATPATRTGAVRLKDAVRAKEAERTTAELDAAGTGPTAVASGATRLERPADPASAAPTTSGSENERVPAATKAGTPAETRPTDGANPRRTGKAYTPKKGRPTPTRREAEAGRRQTLVPVDREAAKAADKEAAKARRERERAERARAREGMLAGEEKYLAERDRGPVKKWLRDLVDSSWNIGDFLLPALFLFIALSVGMAYVHSPWAQYVPLALMWALILGSLLQSYLLARRAKRLIPSRFGVEPPRGVVSYVMTRAFQMRISRSPRPVVTRGTKVD